MMTSQIDVDNQFVALENEEKQKVDRLARTSSSVSAIDDGQAAFMLIIRWDQSIAICEMSRSIWHSIEWAI